MEVINDSEGIFEPGDILALWDNAVFAECLPDLREGMELVFPVLLDPRTESRASFSNLPMYYITDDGYALSVNVESEDMIPSGLPVATLMTRLQKSP